MKNVQSIILLLVVQFAFAQNKQPKLVVGIVIDQMKMEYLYRFNSDFSENGFKRLMNEGYTFHNMHYNYMPTYTAPGHASIYTGTTPAMHGIVSNEWFHRTLKKEVYCTDDDSVATLVSGTEKEGKMSPKNLQTTTITDELKLATNFKGKVIGMSIKDRGAILPAGHFADWAFWYTKTGNFISSSFYGKELPSWVTEFNNEKQYETYLTKGWNLLKPIETYNESLVDDNPYEGKLYKKPPVFPYDLKGMYEGNDAGVLRVTPFGNDVLANLAKRAIEKESLGKDDVTDFLAVSFSSTDYIGHTFGPRSIEIQDTYLRLDLTIADFLNYLDKTVGKGNYLVFMTADHACAENSSHLKDHKYEVDNISYKDVSKDLTAFSNATFGANLLLKYDSYNVHLDKDMIKSKGLDLVKVKQSFKDFLYTKNYVKRVYTEEEILASSSNDQLLSFVYKGYDPTQNGDLYFVYKPGFVEYSATGATHGSPYTYDTNVPCIFYGWNIPKGNSHDKKVITQIAPTLAQKLKITLPNATDSNVLEEVLRN
ncbi:alkaline phosphatase PafA [Flavobacterium dankookense]|uniref:Type I phosphodiesterase/nucleotide pyrophosphatase n=1 Tax=Flavobacterium dankookense TaxID=706186 RepID=A0A4R6QAB2_9FLAO|nr:alkaline phosphatase PafA [Flavobacterium dankookense]TDP59155.1 type I phosphodiesterase/nucleotide pyrophosphatase [Flavobacterium dankookense]